VSGIESPGSPAPAGSDDVRPLVTRIVVRTTLLAISVVLLFPAAFTWVAGGSLTRLLLDMGDWRWGAWAACFVAITLTRFADGPKRE
jgi:hypothetical protein